MGYSNKKKMLSFIIMNVLWEHSDKYHMLSMEQLIYHIKKYYMPESEDVTFAKLIRANIKQLNEFFEDTNLALCGNDNLHIDIVPERNLNRSRGYIYKYCLTGRLLNDTELRYLSDAVLFSPGVSENESEQLLKKIQKLSSRNFGSWFEYVKYSDMVKRTDREELFAKIELVGKAMKDKRKISFHYRKNGVLSDTTTIVSPYYLVISSSKYYLICNKDNKETIAPYRVDRMENVVVDEATPARKISSLKEVEQPFNLKKYMEEHPRMSYEAPVSATLIVSEDLLEAVQAEFSVKRIRRTNDGLTYKVRIVSTKTAICNWIINVTDQIQLEKVSDASVFEILKHRAKCIMEQYKGKTE